MWGGKRDGVEERDGSLLSSSITTGQRLAYQTPLPFHNSEDLGTTAKEKQAARGERDGSGNKAEQISSKGAKKYHIGGLKIMKNSPEWDPHTR